MSADKEARDEALRQWKKDLIAREPAEKPGTITRPMLRAAVDQLKSVTPPDKRRVLFTPAPPTENRLRYRENEGAIEDWMGFQCRCGNYHGHSAQCKFENQKLRDEMRNR